MEMKSKKLLILYATQTENALDVAERIAREAERRACTPLIHSTDEYDASSLPAQDTVIFVVSTTGQGDTPDSMKARLTLILFIHKPYFCSWFVAKKLDKRLSDLGATAVIERGLGDDQHPSGGLNKIKPDFFPEGPDFLVPIEELIGQPKFQVTYHNVDNMDSQLATATDFRYLQMQIGKARSMSSGKVPHEKSKPDTFLKMVFDLF
ncbi:hypothetical protein V6N11_067294 [Hibiscus sabdariffa]|uniref:Flavodoxin-like domain-containing protein n=1 Tax=Hibiscus sabdariffa TaxID=183260 RepID=A0ABR2SR57_9ROSI